MLKELSVVKQRYEATLVVRDGIRVTEATGKHAVSRKTLTVPWPANDPRPRSPGSGRRRSGGAGAGPVPAAVDRPAARR